MAINKVGSKGIEDGSVATADFAPGTVTSAKLEDGAVTNAKLTNTSVTLAGSSVSLGGSVSFNNKFVNWQSVITADGSTGTTAVSGRGYFIDTTSAAHTLTLPSSAAIGDFIAIKDYAGTFNTNNLTIARNGHNIQGVANDSLISTNRASLVLVYVDSTKGWLYWEEHNVADLQGPAFISATGGTITTSGDYKIHSFTGDGCFVVSSLGNAPTVPTGGSNDVEYLVVAGGGGGGSPYGGGGGAGGFRESCGSNGGCYSVSPLAAPCGALTITETTYPVTVGAGGAAAPGGPCAAGSGSNSVFSTITSAGGGAGGSNPSPGTVTTGGSGGGGGSYSPVPYGSGPASHNPGASGNTPPVSPPQGNAGGYGIKAPNGTSGGGGGGASATGGNAVSPYYPSIGSAAGDGGAGVTTSISGTPTSYSGGGGGATEGEVSAEGAGGSGGGGAGWYNACGGSPSGAAGAGTANTGGGGGGGASSPTPGAKLPGAGGKGIVVIRYKFQ